MLPGGPACITCREKCRKCDRAKPVCQRCITKGLKCKGYPEKFRFAGLATRGKWKNRVVPTVSRDHAVPSQLVNVTDHLDTTHGEVNPQEQHASTSDEDRNIELLPIVDTPCPPPERRTSELDIIRSLADPQRLCFSPEVREAVATLSDLKFERVNGCPREMFLIIGNVMEHAKAHATGKIETPEYERLLNACRYQFYSWRLKADRYPNDDLRWSVVAEAFRHACILHTSRLLDATQPAEAQIIQSSVTAILDSLAQIPADCHLIELVVMPLFMAGADALSPYARHYVLLRFDHVRAHGGVGNHMSISLLKSVWDSRDRQPEDDNSNIPWVWFTRNSGSERQHDYLII
ncbi:uncharacterized protein N7479_006378 [Penicillium vulpinum]|uniref:uncharacterized protein n=1 Tax=Penicillium vulpinum TaxID=29845 RepID=UPI002547E44F|nr:uncharacterized protein N7479_006378 [Penicillium vulpinum]KAJ5959228.1 hypothetical protein N7479_006378 [Penicillium vulpinum]